MADGGFSTLTKLGLGLGVLTFNSALAIYRSWGDAGSVAFVLAADAALLLLFLCLPGPEQGRGGRGRDAQTKAAVWALTTLLTAMFASRVAPLRPVAIGLLVLLCLYEIDQVRGGDGINMDGRYYALAKVVCAVAVLTCNSALDAYDTRRDTCSAAFILVSYLTLVIMIGLFMRAFAEHGQGAGRRQAAVVHAEGAGSSPPY